MPEGIFITGPPAPKSGEITLAELGTRIQEMHGQASAFGPAVLLRSVKPLVDDLDRQIVGVQPGEHAAVTLRNLKRVAKDLERNREAEPFGSYQNELADLADKLRVLRKLLPEPTNPL